MMGKSIVLRAPVFGFDRDKNEDTSDDLINRTVLGTFGVIVFLLIVLNRYIRKMDTRRYQEYNRSREKY